jgi:hypothetical protein
MKPKMEESPACVSHWMVEGVALLTALFFAGFTAEAASLEPKHLAVLRAGDGKLDLALRQAPAFIDEFSPGALNSAPLASIAIPTNGSNCIFFNGHASTEGDLARSADLRLLTFAGYGGVNLLQSNGTPSLLDIGRSFCTVDAAGTVRTFIYSQHGGEQKMNPRGAVTDGANNFWGCGNSIATVFFDATSAKGPVVFESIPNSRALRIINKVLYTTLNGPDAVAAGLPPGIFSFQESSGDPAPLPRSASTALKPVVEAAAPYVKIAGFDMNPGGTIAYMADTQAGIQKYARTGNTWKLAYHFSIPQSIPDAANNGKGCFGLVADFSGSAPIIYATTTEGYDGVNSNRVVQIVDTNANAVVTTLAQAPSTKIAFRGIDFTPESKPAKP